MDEEDDDFLLPSYSNPEGLLPEDFDEPNESFRFTDFEKENSRQPRPTLEMLLRNEEVLEVPELFCEKSVF